jgi:hypothetical protein
MEGMVVLASTCPLYRDVHKKLATKDTKPQLHLSMTWLIALNGPSDVLEFSSLLVIQS